jgi:ABC-type glycerol-3-phosphate transport system substrate-binding protein
MNERAKFFLATASVAAASLAVVACATADSGAPSAATQSGNACFLASQVNNFNANPDGTVDIQVGVNQYFRLTTDGMCQNIDFRSQVGIQSTSGSDFICHGYDARFIVPDAVGPGQCAITAIAPLTKEQYQAARTR